jgi:alpha-D-ribose 1-methylphosphonate 5-triphosphate diphosphatase
MSGETIVLANARIVTAEAVVEGSIIIADGVIEAVKPGGSQHAGAIDLAGDYLLPGLVELHTDNLENHFSPRPGVRWPGLAAVIGHDAQVAAAGITTVFDAIAVGESARPGNRLEHLQAMVEALGEARRKDVLRAEHRLHLRCEISHAETLALFQTLLEREPVDMVSIMDHTPGQRQFATVEKFRDYYMNKYGYTAEQFAAFHERQMAAHHRYSAPNRSAIVKLATERGLAIASHDDATSAHVEEAIADGMAIAEFPTTIAAAELSHANGMQVLMGAPNVIRGGSHSGNVSALDLAQRGLLDILSSDYVPGSLLQSAFRLAEEEHITVPQSVAKVSRNPAAAVGLTDRGEIAPGKRADLVRVRDVEGLAVVRTVWRQGQRVI